MSVFTKLARNQSHSCKLDLWLRCDGCGHCVLVHENQDDRLLVHDFIHGNGWKTKKKGDIWLNFCPACIAALEQKRREEWVKGDTSC